MTNSHKLNNPFLFACGVPRSGTTLLQRMLNHHPDLAVANDTHFIPRALELTNKSLIQKAQAGLPIELTPELINNVRNYHRSWRLGIDENEFFAVAANSETYQQLVSGLYGSLTRNSNKRLAGDKTPDYLRRLELLHGLFPAAKLIHILRDGRDVALSLLQWATPNKGPGRIGLWEQQPIAVCAMWWRWFVMAAREQVASIKPTSYYEIKYEQLVREPEHSVRDACEFLGLEFSGQMLEFHCGKSKRSAGHSAKSAWLAPQSGLRNWRADMRCDQVELFEALASDALQEFGYELRHRKYSSQTMANSERCRAWWAEHFLPKFSRTSDQVVDVEPIPTDAYQVKAC